MSTWMTASTSTLLIRNVAVQGRPGLDVRVGPDTVLAVGTSLDRQDSDQVLNGAGGAVIPGLHDHHVHLRAAVAAGQSVDVHEAASPADFDRLVSDAAAAAQRTRGWLRIVGWSEHAAGSLDRYRLDRLVGPRPVRVQHRSGAMWVLNSAAIRQAQVDDCDLPGVERDEGGVLTGRLLRMDDWLRSAVASGADAVPAVAAEMFETGLASYAMQAVRLGVTGFTDATPGRDQADIEEFGRLSAAGIVPQRLLLMASPHLNQPDLNETGILRRGQVTIGPVKVMLDDATLPDVAELAATIHAAHLAGSVVAVHCVTAEQLLVTVAALEQAGPAHDRIEHAGIVPPGYAGKLASLGLAVVTQPGFIGARGSDYLRAVEPAEQDWLYPCASLVRAGVAVAAGTDAPFGPADPWRCIASAMTRRTEGGQVLGRRERLSAGSALRLFMAAPTDPRRLRTVAPGQPSDLCLLTGPVTEAMTAAWTDGVRGATMVRATIIGGRIFGAAAAG
jgi:predicted amidohydrolase YtcJ